MSLQVDEGWVRDYCRRTGTRLPEGMDPPREDKPRENKYHNIPTMEDGKVYPSRREARRHRELKLLQEAGEIRGWAEQVTFLLPGGYDTGRILWCCTRTGITRWRTPRECERKSTC